MTPTKNESLPELPNTEYRGGNDVYGKEFPLYTADQMRAYAEAALTREAPTEGVAEYQYRCPKASDDGWRRMTLEQYEATLATGHACGERGWTRDVEVRRLYATHPDPQRPTQWGGDQATAILSDVLGMDAGRIAWGRGKGLSISIDDALTAVNMALTTQPPHQDRGEWLAAVDRAIHWMQGVGIIGDTIRLTEVRELIADLSEATPVFVPTSERGLATGDTPTLADVYRQLDPAMWAVVCAAIAEAKQQGPGEPLGYTAIFNAIAAATWPAQEGVAINVSVAKFHESIGGNVYTAPQVEAKRQTGGDA